MTRVAVLLRGVNLGARNKVSMPALREALSVAGFTGVQTYVASGNVVVDLPSGGRVEGSVGGGAGGDVVRGAGEGAGDAAGEVAGGGAGEVAGDGAGGEGTGVGDAADAVAGRVRSLVAERFGVDVPCLARTVEELDATVAADPLGLTGPMGTDLEDPRLYTVVFLDRVPDPERLATVDAPAYAPERFAVVGRDVHTWLPAGTHQARLLHSFWERRLGVVGTARNWRTVLALQSLLHE